MSGKDKRGGNLFGDMFGFKVKQKAKSNHAVPPPPDDYAMDQPPVGDPTYRHSAGPEHLSSLNLVDTWSDETILLEFEKMMDDMNINENGRGALRTRILEDKRTMLKLHHSKKDATTEKSHGFDDPQSYHNALASSQSMGREKLARIMESLRIALTNNTVSWLKDFGTKGLDLLLRVLNGCYDQNISNNKIVGRIQHESIKCLKAYMNNTAGLKHVFEHSEALNIAARSICCANEAIATDALKLISPVCLVTPNGHGKALEAITIMGEREGVERFLPIVQKLQTVDVPLKVASITLINCLVNQADDMDFRLHLRNEFMRVGLLDALESLEKEESKTHELEIQLKVFVNHKDEDSDEFLQRFENVRLEFEDLTEVYELLRMTVVDTNAEPMFLSILQHLLFIRDDVAVRPAYYKLVEECVSQIVLHRSGCDPDFRHTKRFHIDVDTITENISDRFRQEEKGSQDLSRQLEEALTAKQEFEAKLSQAQTKIAEFEARIAQGGIPQTPSSGMSAMGIPPPPPPPIGSGGMIPPPPPMPGGGFIPPPPPMPGGSFIPPPPPMPGSGIPPPPPMPGSGIPPPPPMPGCFPPPPPPMPGMMPPPPPFPGMSPGIGFTPSPVALDTLPYGMKPKKKYNPGNTLKRVNWKKLQPQKLSENAFWVKVDEGKLESDDIFESLTSKFCSVPLLKKEKTEEKKVSKKSKELKVIDAKAAQSLMILLGSVKMSPSEMRDYILNIDEEHLNEAMLQQLIRYLPEPEQLSKLDQFQDQMSELAEAEQFAMTIGSIKRVIPRLKSMSFKMRFAEMVQDLKPDIVAATAACEEVKTSKKFSKLLEVVLLIGNYMNAGSRNSQAVGFEINYLTKLSSTKALDSKTTLLHFLAEVVEDKFPEEVIKFPEEIHHLDRAARVSPDLLQKNLNQMKKSVQQLELDLKNFKPQSDNDRFATVMITFLEESRTQCEVLENMFKKMVKLYDELAEYFVFDPQKYSLDEFFGDIKAFRDQFLEAHRENEKQRELIEKQKRVKEAREKAEKEKAERKAQKHMLDITIAGNDQEGVMDNLLEALKTGDAFQHKPRRKAPPRNTGAAAERRAQLNRTRSRTHITARESAGTNIYDVCR